MSGPDLSIIDGGDPIRRRAAAWFARLRADDVSEQDRQQWRHWLALDPRHRVAYERMEQLWSAAGEFAPCPEIGTRIAAPVPDVAPTARRARLHRRRLVGGIMTMTACLLIAIVAGHAILAGRAMDETRYATGIGERRSLQLEDGSRVDMDADTRLVIRFSDDRRLIVLDRGRAFFRVAKERRPLVVRSDNGAVLAVGTQFEVIERDRGLEVALYEGRVDLFSGSDAHTSPTRLASLRAGQHARVDRGRVHWGPPLMTSVAAPPWLSGQLVFENTTLAVAVAEFNRYSSQRIAVESAALGQKRISGVFRSDDPDGFVEALHTVYGIVETRTSSGERLLQEHQ